MIHEATFNLLLIWKSRLGRELYIYIYIVYNM